MAHRVRSWPQFHCLRGLLAALVLLSGACQAAQGTPTLGGIEGCDAAGQKAALQAINGVYFGVNLDWDEETATSYVQRLGVEPAVYVAFARFPFDGAAAQNIDEIVEQVRLEAGMLMLTLEPNSGLSDVTEQTAMQLGDKLAAYNAQGVAVFLRFAHEMNGSWYPWSQQPLDYIGAFREIARVVHERAPLTLMVWGPSYGGGYPFTGGRFVAQPGSDSFALLDTNGDGIISMLDDPYLPYYPGDAAVDWVGMSLYHWGSAYPWGENELPEPGKFVAQLRGNYNGANGDEPPSTGLLWRIL
jgi:hypothetical protein